jgi:hypothetical protein
MRPARPSRWHVSEIGVEPLVVNRPPLQAPESVVMVRPHRFWPNPFTIADNAFQAEEPSATPDRVAAAAYSEVTALARALERVGVSVHLFDDKGAELPDSVFPNNWISTHEDGRIALYPMYSPNRRGERRPDVIRALRAQFKVSSIYDYSVLEDDEIFLEGTGAMVLDHVNRAAYIARSFRANDQAVSRVCRDLGYDPLLFSTIDRRKVPIYHTNVMLSVGTSCALVGLETVPDKEERDRLRSQLESTGRTLVELSHEQIDEFAGNAIEVKGSAGHFLVMSERARRSLRADQVAAIETNAAILAVPVPTVELAGGSVRCMIAGVHLPVRVAGEPGTRPPLAEKADREPDAPKY